MNRLVIALFFTMGYWEMYSLAQAQKYKVVFANLSTTFDDKWVKVTGNIDSNGLINLDVHKVQPFEKFEMLVSIDVYTAGNKANVLDTTVDYCDFLSLNHEHDLLKDLHKNLEKYSNIGNKCPLDKDDYYLKGFKVDDELLPDHLMASSFCCSFTGFLAKDSTKIKLGTTVLFGEIVKL